MNVWAKFRAVPPALLIENAHFPTTPIGARATFAIAAHIAATLSAGMVPNSTILLQMDAPMFCATNDVAASISFPSHAAIRACPNADAEMNKRATPKTDKTGINRE